MAPKVSVNICCYNSERFIKETIESVLSQTFRDFEVVIIDDGSSDRTGEIVKSFSDGRISYCYQKNMGLSASRNRAISMSNGDYIALLDHDDLWEPEKLELQTKLLDQDPATGLVFSDGYTISENDRITNRFFKLSRPHRGNVFAYLVRKYWISCSTVIFRKELLSKSGNFNTDFAIAEEYDLFLRMARITKFDYIDKPLVRYRLHRQNTSRNAEGLLQEHIKILLNLARVTDDEDLGKRISDLLAGLHAELATIYLLTGQSFSAKKEAKLALERSRVRPFVLIAYMCSYLPKELSRKAAWIMKKSRSAFKRCLATVEGRI